MSLPDPVLAAGVVLVPDRDRTLAVAPHGTFVLGRPSHHVTAVLQGTQPDPDLIGELEAADLLARSAGATSVAGTQIRILGSGSLALEAARALLRAGAELILWDNQAPSTVVYPQSLQPTGARALAQELGREQPAAAHRVRVVNHWDKPELTEPALTVLATGYLEIDRAVTDALVRAGQPHLAVQPLGSGAIVGPLVLPGVSPCTRCMDLVRADRQPSWPQVLTGLCRVRLDPDAPWCGWAAGQVLLCAAQVCGRRPLEVLSRVDLLGCSWEIAGPGHRLGVREWPVHPDCGCHRALTELW